MNFLIVIIALALVFDYINGFHDAANSIATVVSTKVLTPGQAVIWAALFNFVAYFIFKDHGVANTIAKTVKPEMVAGHDMLLVIFSGLLSAIFWNLFTWWYGIPSSSSHALIGAFAGAAISFGGFAAINSEPIFKTISFILLAPVIGMIIAFIISLWFIHSFKKGWMPKIIAFIVLIFVALFLKNNLITDPALLKTNFKSYPMRVVFTATNFKWILLSSILTIMAVFTIFLNRLNANNANAWFKRLQLVSSAAFSIGHGGNDAQKVMGIIAAAMVSQGVIGDVKSLPQWVPLACYTAIALGTMFGGWKIVKTMGQKVTKLTPFEGFSAEAAGAITLFGTQHFKIPVSTTHTITGSIIGVGITKRISAVRWGVTIQLLWAWVLTIPVSAGLAALVYYGIRGFLE